MVIDKKRIGAYLGSNQGLYGSLTNWIRELDLAVGLGLGLMRFNSDAWDLIQPTASTFDFTVLDKLVDECQARNLDIIFTTPISATWNRPAGTDTHTPTTNMEAVRKLVGAVAIRYAGRIKYYEAWNEPDYPNFWKPTPNATAYVEYLRMVYDTVKSCDPQALVINGGLAFPADPTFLQAVVAAGGQPFIDIANVHIYPAFATVTSALATINTVLGVDFPVIVTEISSTGGTFDTTDRPAEENKKGVLLATSYHALLQQSRVKGVVWHSLRNPVGLDFGLMDNAFVELPAMAVHRAISYFAS